MARAKMADAEYLVCITTFLAILLLGVEVGMFAGIMAAMVCFVLMYANMATVSVASLRSSTVVRTFEEQVLLGQNRCVCVFTTILPPIHSSTLSRARSLTHHLSLISHSHSYRGKIVTIQLSGYIFFGSAVQVSRFCDICVHR